MSRFCCHWNAVYPSNLSTLPNSLLGAHRTFEQLLHIWIKTASTYKQPRYATHATDSFQIPQICLVSCKMIKPTWESFSFMMSFLWSTFPVSETHCDLDFLKLTQLLLLISLWGHWIQEIAKFNIHVKPLIKAVLILQSLWFCFDFNIWCLIIISTKPWMIIMIFSKNVCFFVYLNLED